MNSRWLLIAGLAASLSAADTKAPPWEKSRFAAGRDLFRENCAICHDIETDQRHTKKLGPSFNHLFKNERMPLSHMKPNWQYITVRIKFGGALMPAFGKILNDSEINTLIDYLASQ